MATGKDSQISTDVLRRGARVLVVKPSSLGDVVHTLPAVHALKQWRPDLRIDWLVNTEWAPLLSGNADLRRVIPFPRRDFRGLMGWLKLRGWLREADIRSPHLALDFQGLARSGIIARLVRSRRLHCLGDAELIPRMLAHRIVPARRKAEHSIDRYLRLIRDLGVRVDEPLISPLPEGEAVEGVPAQPFVLVHPFSRGSGKSFRRPALTALLEGLSGLPVVVAGRSLKHFDTPSGIVNLTNRTTLLQLIWLIRRASFVVSVDSGPMHIAAALTSKLLSVHTWSDPRLVGPHNPDAWVWKGRELYRVREEVKNRALPIAEPSLEDARAMAAHVRRELKSSIAVRA